MSFFNFQFWNEIGIHKKVLFHSNFKMKIEWYFWCTDWYHGWDFFYLMVKSGKSFVKIGFRFQIALRNFQPPPPPSLFRPPTYFILPNVPTTKSSDYFGSDFSGERACLKGDANNPIAKKDVHIGFGSKIQSM